MKIIEEEKNRIRCTVALTVPIVLDYLAAPTATKYEDIRHYLPAYVLSGVDNATTEVLPYFSPWNLKDQGKKRIYVNANGYRIRYIASAKIRRYRDSAKEFLKSIDESLATDEHVKKELEKVGSRWVIMKGDLSGKKTWEDLMNSIVAREARPNQDNHPPTGDDSWLPECKCFHGMRMQDVSTHPILKKYDFQSKFHGEAT